MSTVIFVTVHTDLADCRRETKFWGIMFSCLRIFCLLFNIKIMITIGFIVRCI